MYAPFYRIKFTRGSHDPDMITGLKLRLRLLIEMSYCRIWCITNREVFLLIRFAISILQYKGNYVLGSIKSDQLQKTAGFDCFSSKQQRLEVSASSLVAI